MRRRTLRATLMACVALSRGWTRRLPLRATVVLRGQKRQRSNSLEWERFEFGTSPKLDTRFTAESQSILSANEIELEELIRQETLADNEEAMRRRQQSAAWELMDPQVVANATEILSKLVNPRRQERIRSVLNQRTTLTQFLFENPSNPSNVFACLRNLDSFGIQHVNMVVDSSRYQGKAALAQKRGLRTAMGSAQWLSLVQYSSTRAAVDDLRHQGVHIYASDVNPSAKDVRDVDWQTPLCIVMGNEETGISSDLREIADETFYLPMTGFCESFNLSSATAITLAHLSSATEGGQGPLAPGTLSAREYDCLLLKGLLQSVPKKRVAEAVLKQAGIVLPKEMELL